MKALKLISIACLVVLSQSFVVDVESSEDVKHLNSAEYVLYGYNLLYANPVPTALDGLQDNGWRQPIFDDHPEYYTDNAHLQGKNYKVPSGTYVQPNLSCSSTYSAENFDNTSSYQKSLKTNTKIHGKGLYGSFSGSATFDNLSEETKSSSREIIQSTSKCLAYIIGVYDGDLPPLSRGFVNTLKQLPLEYNSRTKSYYLDFFEMFGTHYPKKISMGSLIGSQSTYQKEDLDKLSKSGMDIDATANLISESGEGGGSNHTEKQKENMQKLKSVQKNTQKIAYGTFIPDRDDSTSWMQQILDKQPMPMMNELEDLPQLLKKQVNKKSFEQAGLNWSDVQQWGKNLEKALQQYCVNANNGDEDQCKVYQQTQTCSFCQQRCGGKFPYDGGSYNKLETKGGQKQKFWIKYTETFGVSCKGKVLKLAKDGLNDPVKLCCAQPYKKNELVQTTQQEDEETERLQELEIQKNYEEQKELEKLQEKMEKSTSFLKKPLEVPIQPTRANNDLKAQCRLCNTCGSGFNYDGGSVSATWTQIGKWDKKHWWGKEHMTGHQYFHARSLQYYSLCGGDYFKSNMGRTAQLCCKDEAPVCQMCTSCGQDYPITKGTFRFDMLSNSHDNHYRWSDSNAMKAKGNECSGIYKDRSVYPGHGNYVKKVNLCCQNKQVEVKQS